MLCIWGKNMRFQNKRSTKKFGRDEVKHCGFRHFWKNIG